MTDQAKFRTRDWIVGVATTAALAVAGWSLLTDISQGERLTAIEENRFTATDAAGLKMEIVEKMQEPPRWFKERVDLLITKVGKLDDKVDDMNRRLDRGGE